MLRICVSCRELVLVPAWGLNDLCSLNTSFGRGGDDVTYEVSYRLGLEELSKSYRCVKPWRLMGAGLGSERRGRLRREQPCL